MGLMIRASEPSAGLTGLEVHRRGMQLDRGRTDPGIATGCVDGAINSTLGVRPPPQIRATAGPGFVSFAVPGVWRSRDRR
jgi:hypothetical protein